jgi:hypothetical protein
MDGQTDRPRRPRRHWTKLPPIAGPFDRVPDDAAGRRMVRCHLCGRLIPTLGIGYHLQAGARPCNQRETYQPI